MRFEKKRIDKKRKSPVSVLSEPIARVTWTKKIAQKLSKVTS